MPFFLEKKRNKETIPLTHDSMTRFNISMSEAIETIIWSFKNCIGREIVVPKLKSFNVVDLIKIIDRSAKVKIIGVRPGEKIHEELISISEARHTLDIGKYYVILSPSLERSNNPLSMYLYKKYLNKKNTKKVSKDFEYNSGRNKEFLNTEEIRKLLKDN